MALLRLSNGKIYTSIAAINELIKPVEIGTFAIPQEVARAVSDPSVKFDRNFAKLIYERAAPDIGQMIKARGFNPKAERLAVYIPPAQPSDSHQFIAVFAGQEDVDPAPLRDEDFAAYLVPHRFPINDWHFCFGGTMAKGLLLEDGSQAVLYVFTGEWMKLKPSVINWPIFQSASPIVGFSCFEEEPNEHGAYDIEVLPDVTPEDTMRF